MSKQKKPPDPLFSSLSSSPLYHPSSPMSASLPSSLSLNAQSRVSWKLVPLSLRRRSLICCLFRIYNYSSTILGRFRGFSLSSYGRSIPPRALNLPSFLSGWISRIQPLWHNPFLSYPIYCSGGFEIYAEQWILLRVGDSSRLCVFLFSCGCLEVAHSHRRPPLLLVAEILH